ncbi:MAG: HlyD family efflux transporter periplasmic adaptor subunit [Chloroflexales bacterium]|nr:HlyD family efflux transporter periplasmic adaptor subunit [Chloroflexales bacterium]
MKRALMLAVGLCGVLLASCAKTTPVVETTPQEVPTQAPTSSLPAMGSMAPTSEPTAGPAAEPAQTYTVQRATIEDALSFGGQVAPVQSSISFNLDGVIAKIYVQPGQTIQKGDLVAELEVSDLAAQLRDARLSYEQNQRSLGQASQATQLAIKQAELDLEDARQALEELKAPASPVKVAEAQTAVRAAQASLDTVRNNASQLKNSARANLDQSVGELQAIQEQYGLTVNLLARTRDAQAKSDLSDKIKELETQMAKAEAAMGQAQIAYDTARNNEVAAVKDAEAKLDLAKAQLDALLHGPDQFQIATQERVVRRAEIAVAKAQLDSTPDPTLTRAVEASRLQIQELEKAIAANQLYAPFGGEIAAIAASSGTPVQGGTPVVTLVDRSRIEILADSTTLDIGSRKTPPQLSVGQPVEIAFSRHPGKVLSGTITLAPNDQNPDSTDKNYHVGFDAQGLSLDMGDLADLRVSLGRKYDALWLPPEAVRFSGDRATVMVSVDGKDKQIDVLTGIVTADKIEILSGLKENDVVIGQ